MKRSILGIAGVALALTLAPAAYATAFTAADMHITLYPDGSISADFGNSGIKKGFFTDTFSFTIAADGVGSGSVTTSTSSFHKRTDLDLISVLVNGLPTTANSGPGLIEFAGIGNVPVIANVQNVVTIHGYSYGNGSYGANATFVPDAVPEVATWALMLVGFGAVGAGLRYQRRSTKVAFS